MRRFRDWPIGARIAAGVAVPLAIAALISAKGLIALDRVAAEQARTAAATAAGFDAASAHTSFLELKVAVREYIARNSEARFRRTEQVHQEAERSTTDPQDREALARYWSGFREVVARRTEQNRLRDQELRAFGTELRALITGQLAGWDGQALVERHLLLMRSYADRFLDSGNEADATRVREESLDNYLADNVNAWALREDGRYVQLTPEGEAAPHSAQGWLLARLCGRD